MLFPTKKASEIGYCFTKPLAHFSNHLIDLHIVDQNDRQDLQDLITRRIKELIVLIKKSSQFRKYFYIHNNLLFLAIFYEVHDFLFSNKHYRFSDEKSNQLQWIELTRLIINDTKFLSTFFNFKSEWNKFETCLQNFSEKIYEKDIKTLSIISDFYKNQKMNHHANKVNAAIAKIQLNQNQSNLAF